MTVIKRTGYLSTNNCDAMVAALPTLPDAAGKEYRNSDAVVIKFLHIKF